MTRGGARKGSGKKKLDPGDKLKGKTIFLLPHVWLRLAAWARVNNMTVQAAIRLAVERLLANKN